MPTKIVRGLGIVDVQCQAMNNQSQMIFISTVFCHHNSSIWEEEELARPIIGNHNNVPTAKPKLY